MCKTVLQQGKQKVGQETHKADTLLEKTLPGSKVEMEIATSQSAVPCVEVHFRRVSRSYTIYFK